MPPMSIQNAHEAVMGIRDVGPRAELYVRRLERVCIGVLFIQLLGFLTFYRSSDLTELSLQAYFTSIPTVLGFCALLWIARNYAGFSTFLGNAISPVLILVGYGLASSLWAMLPLIAAAKNLTFLVQLASILLLIHIARLGSLDLPRCLLTASVAVIFFALAMNLLLFGEFFHFRQALDWNETAPVATNFIERFFAGAYRERLQLIETHPLDVSNIASVSFILCCFGSMTVRKKAAICGFLIFLLYFAGGRGAFIGLAFACAAALLISRGAWRLMALGALLIANLLILQIWDALVAISAQADTVFADIDSLSGRIPLWRYGLEVIISDGFATVFGFGRESGRELFRGVLFSPGDSHNAFLEIFLSYGLAGLSIAVVILVRLARAAVVSRLGLALMVYALILSAQGAYLFMGGYVDFAVLLTLGHLDALRRDRLAQRE